MSKTNPKIKAILDSENFRFVVSPLDNDSSIKVPAIFRAIKRSTNTSWKELADFAGLKNQNAAFRVTYTNDRKLIESLNPFVAIDPDQSVAYFYDKDHQPADSIVEEVAIEILNKEASKQTVTAKIPTKIVTRVTVVDPSVRNLRMKLTPTNGYLLGIRDIHLTNPDMTYVVTGTAGSLNTLLKNIHFIGVEKGDAEVVIVVDDMTGSVENTVSTTISLKVEEGVEPSIPELTVVSGIEATLDEETAVEGIEVVDADGKIMELRIQPYNCEVFGFKSIIKPIYPGQVHSVFGRPETLNDEIADLKIRARSTNAQLAFELVCGTTKVRDYIIFDVKDPNAEETPEVVSEPAPQAAPKAAPVQAPAPAAQPVQESAKEPAKEETEEKTEEVPTEEAKTEKA